MTKRTVVEREDIVELWDYLQAGRVTRFHTLPDPVHQTTAEHAGRVALIAWVLSGKTCRAQVLVACLAHDLPEAITGDVPAPAKWASLPLANALKELESRLADPWPVMQVMEQLTPKEEDLLALADALDGVFTCVQGVRAGHHAMLQPYHAWMSYLRQRWPHVHYSVWDWFRCAITTPTIPWTPWSHLDNG